MTSHEKVTDENDPHAANRHDPPKQRAAVEAAEHPKINLGDEEYEARHESNLCGVIVEEGVEYKGTDRVEPGAELRFVCGNE